MDIAIEERMTRYNDPSAVVREIIPTRAIK